MSNTLGGKEKGQGNWNMYGWHEKKTLMGKEIAAKRERFAHESGIYVYKKG